MGLMYIPRKPDPFETFLPQLARMMATSHMQAKFAEESAERREKAEIRREDRAAARLAEWKKKPINVKTEQGRQFLETPQGWRPLTQPQVQELTGDVKEWASTHKGKIPTYDELMAHKKKKADIAQKAKPSTPQKFDKNLLVAAQAIGINPQKVVEGKLSKEEAQALAKKYSEMFGTQGFLQMLMSGGLGGGARQGGPAVIRYDKNAKELPNQSTQPAQPVRPQIPQLPPQLPQGSNRMTGQIAPRP